MHCMDDIRLFDFKENGCMELIASIRQEDNPSYMVKDHESVLVVAEHEDYGAVYRYRIGEDGIVLDTVSRFPGKWACSMNLDSQYVYVSCYGSGTLTVLNRENLNLERTISFTENSNIHCHCFWNGNHVIADLGDDSIWIGPDLDHLSRFSCPGGPRQVFCREDYLYSVQENSNTIIRWNCDMETVKIVPTTKSGIKDFTGGAVMIGDMIFVANRGPDTIACFDEDLFTIGEYPCGGLFPRSLSCMEYGENNILACCCQKSDECWLFLPVHSELRQLLSVSQPCCSCFLVL